MISFIVGPIVTLIIGLLIATPVLVYVPFWPVDLFWAFIWIFLPFLGLVFAFLRWTKTSFAVTDKRAMSSRGLFSRNVSDCGYDKIQNTNMNQGVWGRAFGYGNIIFATAGISSMRERHVLQGGGVFWKGAKDPVATRRFVQDLVENQKREQKMVEFQDMAAVLKSKGAAMPTTQTSQGASGQFCSKCGARNTVGAKFCNSCGAPLG